MNMNESKLHYLTIETHCHNIIYKFSESHEEMLLQLKKLAWILRKDKISSVTSSWLTKVYTTVHNTDHRGRACPSTSDTISINNMVVHTTIY